MVITFFVRISIRKKTIPIQEFALKTNLLQKIEIDEEDFY